ncbi:polysaccharide export protein [Panacibacter sp. DH6]|uniref:Polysaccharide export protein n=1 Tax=Panacibacter microcysteis TaxID=2793269 RepID=A0A931E630_9BACT|nr:polysaccharide biosynthesis/export family protein [Panacibacter microcysteis]MBG9376847.1 polysaccharide export protein [Panacibacter microcysteis]
MKKLTFYTKSLLYPVLFLFLISFFATSCKTERIAILKDIPDTTSLRYIPLAKYTPPTVRVDDILNIVIQTLDPQANTILNQGNLPATSGAVSGGSAAQAVISGYLVGKDGSVRMPYIGTVHVAGLTTEQIRDTVSNRIAFYFKDPVVNVRFANFKVTVLGEVKNPSTFLIPNEKPSIIDAVGLAGDITIYGRRDNVMLIRDYEGQKEITRINLDSSKSVSSPYFFLRPNDVIYVEASASKVQSTDAYRNRNYSIIAAALGFLTILSARLLFK